MRAQGLFVVRQELGFAFKGHLPSVSFIKRELTDKSYQITRHPHIHFGSAPVEPIAFNEPHKDMVAPVLQANQPLNKESIKKRGAVRLSSYPLGTDRKQLAAFMTRSINQKFELPHTL